MPATTGEPALDLSVVPTDRYPLIRILNHSEAVLCAYAFDTENDTPVFIKVKDAEVASNGLRVAREADILASLAHPQIPRLIDADVAGDQPFPYVVSELKPGGAYPKKLLDEKFIPRLAAKICLSALEPLGYAHGQGFIHRDVKPDNLLMRTDGRQTSLVDFELGMRVDPSPSLDMVKALLGNEQQDLSRITQVGEVVGTADYISPERALGRRGDQRSDIYSMGVVLYRLLYASEPFRGKAGEVAELHVSRPIDFYNKTRDIPEALIGVMEVATQKEPNYRYASAGEMGEALERYLTDTSARI
jgi:serine/threonine protein kinase